MTRNWFSNLSIRHRLTLIIMAVSMVAVLLTGVLITLFGIYHLRQNMATDLTLSAEVAGDRNAAALIFDDPEVAQRNLSVFESKPSIQRVCLYRKDEVFAYYLNPSLREESGYVPCPPPQARETIQLSTSQLFIYKPIVKLGDAIGGIYLESDLREIHAFLHRQFLTALAVAIGVSLFSFFMARIMQESINRPIMHLARTARKVAVNKDFSVRAEIPEGSSRRNELDMLVSAFNTMLAEIEASEKRLMQQNHQLERARVVAESASRTKSEFLANISHELRTPLNAIIGFSDIIRQQMFGTIEQARYLEYARDINESGTHLLHIINDILDLSKAEAGMMRFDEQEMDIATVLRHCVKLLEERADRGEVLLKSKIPENLPRLIADEHRFKQIVLNILSNAVKFTEEGGRVTVSAQYIPAGDKAGMQIIIEDTGIGMDLDEIDQALQYFGQIDSGLNRRYEGTGLGLPLAKKLLHLHQGEMIIHSTPGSGTTVILSFPLKRVVQATQQMLEV